MIITALMLERTLAAFIKRQLEPYRLDNPQVNLVQPDEVPYDALERHRSLALKVPPTVVCGFLPKTVTGAIDPEKLPGYPFISVRATEGRADWRTATQGYDTCTASILIGAYDENPDRSGYQDCLNMIGAIKFEFIRFRVIDQSYSIIPPLTWALVEADLFPHFVAEMTTQWQLPLASHIEEVTKQTPWVPRDLADLRSLVF